MNTRNLNKYISILLCVLLTSCDSIESQSFSDEEINKIDAMQNPFGSPVHRLMTPGTSSGVPYVIDECKIYRGALSQSGVIVGWTVAFETETKLLRSCVDSYIVESGEYLIFGIKVKDILLKEGGYELREFRKKYNSIWQRRYKRDVCSHQDSSMPCHYEVSQWLPNNHVD